ncbi:hypothetical protein D9758_008776 [Tetrapyrgos nigripes]|uniref:Uncharacterized protein n=1 Tax=Tetrapyrgos nigripes TaxID=182062 RepID=A0A8H5D5K3_9AGAR|nr:hypothetical protein D9758_008776 [Tetrapyrgos nigripes]
MTQQKFVGDKPVDEFPKEAIQKRDESELQKDPKAGKRAGAASLNPEDYDVRNPGSKGDTQPVQSELDFSGLLDVL